MNPRLIQMALLIALFSGCLSAFGGFVLLLTPSAGGLPPELLSGSPFGSFVFPGVILGIVVGGTQLIGAIGLLRKWRYSSEWVAIAGFGMIIWIYAEIYIIQQVSWLQTTYFGLGIVELILLLLKLRYRQLNDEN
jgi:hypothetical protein